VGKGFWGVRERGRVAIRGRDVPAMVSSGYYGPVCLKRCIAELLIFVLMKMGKACKSGGEDNIKNRREPTKAPRSIYIQSFQSKNPK
jgi:hypothetical protein